MRRHEQIHRLTRGHIQRTVSEQISKRIRRPVSGELQHPLIHGEKLDAGIAIGLDADGKLLPRKHALGRLNVDTQRPLFHRCRKGRSGKRVRLHVERIGIRRAHERHIDVPLALEPFGNPDREDIFSGVDLEPGMRHDAVPLDRCKRRAGKGRAESELDGLSSLVCRLVEPQAKFSVGKHRFLSRLCEKVAGDGKRNGSQKLSIASAHRHQIFARHGCRHLPDGSALFDVKRRARDVRINRSGLIPEVPPGIADQGIDVAPGRKSHPCLADADGLKIVVKHQEPKPCLGILSDVLQIVCLTLRLVAQNHIPGRDQHPNGSGNRSAARLFKALEVDLGRTRRLHHLVKRQGEIHFALCVGAGIGQSERALVPVPHRLIGKGVIGKFGKRKP